MVLVLDNFQVPANVGSIFRLADALGVDKLYLTGSTPVPPNRNIKKTSRSTEKFVSFEYVSDPLVAIAKLKQLSYQIVALEITDSSQPLAEVEFGQTEKIAVILGAESSGVSQALLDVSDYHVHIPMQGQNSSMNVAVACGIAVYQLIQAMRRA